MAGAVLPGTGNADFELRLYEGQTRFDVIYGTVDNGNTSATAGVQKNTAPAFTQYFCNGAGSLLPAAKATRCNLAGVRRRRLQERPVAHREDR